MNAVHERPFAEALTVLAEVFEKKLSPQLMALYFEALAHYEWELIEVALRRAVTACRFFPRPAELIEQIEGTPEERVAEAEQAWRQFYAALNEAGTYQSLDCQDPVLAETIRLIFRSWTEASHLPRPESNNGPMYQVHHKEFVAAYQRLRVAMAERQRPYEPYLQGRIEADNRPEHLARLGQALMVTYLPRQGRPLARPLAAVLPQHPLVALESASPALEAAAEG